MTAIDMTYGMLLVLFFFAGMLARPLFMKRPGPPPPCQHLTFAIIAAQPVKVDLPPGYVNTSPPMTVILRRCSCGEHSTQMLNGTWTLHQLLLHRSEIDELERMTQ